MRIRPLVLAALFCAVLPTAQAQSQPQAQAQAQAQAQLLPITKEGFAGKWKALSPHPKGGQAVTVVQFSPDMRFTASASLDGTVFWEASGSWKVTGKVPEWKYEQSSPPAIPKGFVDTDDIKGLTAGELTLTSRLSGDTHVYRRVQ